MQLGKQPAWNSEARKPGSSPQVPAVPNSLVIANPARNDELPPNHAHRDTDQYRAGPWSRQEFASTKFEPYVTETIPHLDGRPNIVPRLLVSSSNLPAIRLSHF